MTVMVVVRRRRFMLFRLCVVMVVMMRGRAAMHTNQMRHTALIHDTAMRTTRLHQAVARWGRRRRNAMVMLHHNGCNYLHHYLSISLRGSHCCQAGYCHYHM